MGLSILYKGNLIQASDLSALIAEVIDIASVYKWDYFVFENEFRDQSFSENIDF